MLNIPTLLTIPNHSPAQGSLPAIAWDQYLGYYDSGQRQLVFVFEHGLQMAKIYLSSQPWNARLEMRYGRLPPNIMWSMNETRWLSACWQAATLRFKGSALENVIERALFGTTR